MKTYFYIIKSTRDFILKFDNFGENHMKGTKNNIMIIVGILLVLLGLILVYFNISYSPLKGEFNNDLSKLTYQHSRKTELFTKEDFKNYPPAIKKFMEKNGYIDKKKMNYTNIFFENADFIQDSKKPKLKIDYDQYNFSKNPARLAYIKSSLFSIPFEGYDYFLNGHGGMKGILAKNITLFDQKGADMDKGALCTYLAECLFVPSSLLENNISFEEIDSYNVRASINYKGNIVSGIFTFNKDYEMIKFYTSDRAAVKDDGTVEYIPWTAKCSNYKVNEDGINLPYKLKAIWNYPEYDLVYFDGNVKYFSYK